MSGAGSPGDSAVFRYGDGGGGKAYAAIRTSSTAQWPSPREGHAAAMLGNGATLHLFGGKDRNGNYLNDYWQLNQDFNTLGADFDYQWKKTNVPGGPDARWDHSVVTTPTSYMIVYGGIRKNVATPVK